MIEKIEQKINSIFESHHLKAEKIFSDYVSDIWRSNGDIHSTFNTICHDDKGDEYFFKILIKKDISFRKSIENEINFSKVAGSFNFNKFKYPEIKEYEMGEFCWYLRECYKGQILGDGYKLDSIQESKLAVYSDKIIEAVIELNSTKKSDTSFQNLFRINYKDNYINSLLKNERFINLINPDYIKDAEAYLNKSIVVNDPDLVLCHGDCHFGNFIFQENEPPYWLDWAVVHWGNIASDYSKLWLSLWQYPEIQKRVASKFVESLNSDQKESLSINVIPMLLFHATNKLAWAIWIKQDKERFMINPEAEDALLYFTKIFRAVLSKQAIT